jgi:hypothetical protein
MEMQGLESGKWRTEEMNQCDKFVEKSSRRSILSLLIIYRILLTSALEEKEKKGKKKYH